MDATDSVISKEYIDITITPNIILYSTVVVQVRNQATGNNARIW